MCDPEIEGRCLQHALLAPRLAYVAILVFLRSPPYDLGNGGLVAFSGTWPVCI